MRAIIIREDIENSRCEVVRMSVSCLIEEVVDDKILDQLEYCDDESGWIRIEGECDLESSNEAKIKEYVKEFKREAKKIGVKEIEVK